MARLAAGALAPVERDLGPLAAAERCGLASRLAAQAVELVAQGLVLAFELGDALAELAVHLAQAVGFLPQCIEPLLHRVRHHEPQNTACPPSG